MTQAYVTKHKLAATIEKGLKEALASQPDNPYEALSAWFAKNGSASAAAAPKKAAAAAPAAAAPAPAPEAAAPAPEAAAAAEVEPGTEYAVGDSVVVHGLKSQPEHNERTGTVQEFNAEKGRYVLKMPGQKKTLAVKPANLTPG